MADRITSPEQLKALAQKAKADIDLREGRKETQVTVHMGTCGIAAGAREIVAAFMTELSANGVSSASLHQSGCAGLCEAGADGDHHPGRRHHCTATACWTRTRSTRSSSTTSSAAPPSRRTSSRPESE